MNRIIGSGTRKLILESTEKQLLVFNELVQTIKKLYSITSTNTMINMIDKFGIIGVSGGAEGFDELFLNVLDELCIPNEIHIPNKTYGDYYWKKNSLTGRDRSKTFNYMLDSHNHIFVCPSLYVNGEHSNLIRNKNMCIYAYRGIGFVYNPSGASRGTIHCRDNMIKNHITVFDWNEKLNQFIENKTRKGDE